MLCNGNGVYNRGHCECHNGWKGVECDVRENECIVPNCNGNGVCVDGRCECHEGFNGVDCGNGKSCLQNESNIKDHILVCYSSIYVIIYLKNGAKFLLILQAIL